MKRMKKIFSLLLTAVLVLMMSVNVFATSTTYSSNQTFTVTVNTNETGHEFVAYQIFKGDLSVDVQDVADNASEEEKAAAQANAKYVLSNTEWGNGVDQEKTVNGKTLANLYASVDDAVNALENNSGSESSLNEFALAIADYLDDENVYTASANTPYTFTGLPAGYYLIKDKDDSLANEENRSYTRYMLQIVKDLTITPKSAIPTVEKKVKDTNDSDANDSTSNTWMDSADYDIGDTVTFKLTATLPSNLSYYKTYKIVFHDTLSAGFTYKNISSVSVGDTPISNGWKVDTSSDEDGSTALTITFDNVKTLNNGSVGNNDTINVEYTAELNNNAVIGSAGNPNTVYLEYSNNPNQTGTGDPETGNTPEDKVIVFTYKLVINKIDDNNNPLTGATFKLEKKLALGGTTEIAYTLNDDADDGTAGTVFTFKGIDAGTYVLTETGTPAGYNTIDPITFKIEATHDATSDNPTLTELKAGSDTTSLGDIELTPALTAGSLTGDVMNRAGDTLPSTGGMGTRVFMITGSILALGAVVLMITKKRMGVIK